MKKLIIAVFGFAAVVLVAPLSHAADYALLISRNCQLHAYEHDRRYVESNLRMHSQTIRIKSTRQLGGGWVRVHAIGQTLGRHTSGFADIHPRSGRVRCDPDNWHVQPERLLDIWDD